MPVKLKETLLAALDKMAAPGDLFKVRRDDNHGAVLGKIFIYQEMKKHAEKQLKKAWAEAQEEGLIPPDDELRTSTGETIVLESRQFTCMTKVAAARENFSKEEFMEAVSKRFKIDMTKLKALAQGATHDGAAPLEKRIVEA